MENKDIKFAQMVEKYMRLNNLTMKELGAKVNRGESTVSMWIAGKSTPPMGVVQKLADLFGVSTDVMVHGEHDDKLQELPIIFNDYFPLKYNTNLSAGTFDEIMDSEPNAVVYVPIKFQMKKDQLKAFKVNGSSMNNVIPDESIVVTEPVGNALDIKDGTIVAAWYEGTATVKRFYQSENIVTLMPDSSDRSHQPIMINTDIAPVHIIGRVIWHMNPDNIENQY